MLIQYTGIKYKNTSLAAPFTSSAIKTSSSGSYFMITSHLNILHHALLCKKRMQDYIYLLQATDNSVTVQYENQTMYAILSVFGVII